MSESPEQPPTAAQRAGRLAAMSVRKAREAMASPAVKAAGKKAASAASSRYLNKAKGPAGQLLRNKDRLLSLATRADKVAGRTSTGSGPMARAQGELTTLLRLIRAYASGQYRQIPVESMVLVVAAVGYVVSPIDLVPDFIPGIGGLDDATVLGFVLGLVRKHLDEFLAWEQSEAGAAGG